MKRHLGATLLVLSVPTGAAAALLTSNALWALCVTLLGTGLALTKDGPCPRCGNWRCTRHGRCGR